MDVCPRLHVENSDHNKPTWRLFRRIVELVQPQLEMAGDTACVMPPWTEVKHLCISAQHRVNVPDVSTKYVSDWCADKVSLASNGSLVSGANLLPLILTTLFLLISQIFLHTWLGLWSVGRGSFCSKTKTEKTCKRSSTQGISYFPERSWKIFLLLNLTSILHKTEIK